jgi:hypothetical protein
MSLEDMEQDGILLPRDQWGTRELRTRVGRWPMVVIAILAVVAAVLMYLGNGNVVTWIGAGLFLVSLAGFTWVSLRGIGSGGTP